MVFKHFGWPLGENIKYKGFDYFFEKIYEFRNLCRKPEVGIDIDLISEPRPPPRCMYSKCGNLCGQRDRKRFIASWDLRMSHFVPAPHAPPPQGIGQRLKAVILPTTAVSQIKILLRLTISVIGQFSPCDHLFWTLEKSA